MEVIERTPGNASPRRAVVRWIVQELGRMTSKMSQLRCHVLMEELLRQIPDFGVEYFGVTSYPRTFQD